MPTIATNTRVQVSAMPHLRIASDRVAATNAVAERFFGENAEAISRVCQAMAERFERGSRMLVCGDGAQRSDVAHVVVEFVHPVMVGKRALPAVALPAIAGGAARRALSTLGRDGDLLLLLAASAPDEHACALVADAGTRGLLTIALTGPVGAMRTAANHPFEVPSADSCIVQETHEMLYHILWELVHVFFEHRPVTT